MPLTGWRTRSLTPEKVALVQGQRYRGTVELAWYQTFASNERVAEEFVKLGFTDVTVTGSGSVREGEGTWSKPDQTIDRPEQIKTFEPVQA
jgi:hypothetical protein